MVINKNDLLDETTLTRIRTLYPDASFVTASTGEGLDELVAAITTELESQMTLLHLSVPYDRGDVVASAHRLGEVVAEKHDEHGTLLDVRIPSHRTSEFTDFMGSEF